MDKLNIQMLTNTLLPDYFCLCRDKEEPQK